MPGPITTRRIAFLIQGLDAPSTRIRISNLLPFFREAGIETIREVYPNRMRGWFRVARAIAGAEVLVVQKRLPSRIESLLLTRLARRVVFDFDDSVWLRNREGDARRSRKLMGRFRHFLRRVDLAICGNPILQEFLRQQCPATASVVIPSSVPVPEPRILRKPESPLRIGWVGTAINLPYLVAIEPALTAAHARVPFELVVLSSEAPRFESFPHWRFIPWSEQTEYCEIQQFDVGIMPLADNEHSRGKCAYKALQYMRCGVPVIGSDVGINREWIENVGAGLVVRPDGWADALVRLLSDAPMRERMGAAGLRAIESRFTQVCVAAQYIAAFKQLDGSDPASARP
jgi:glycosyltransferase involved in cell wall biosynthesis